MPLLFRRRTRGPRLTPQGFSDWLERCILDEFGRGGPGWMVAEDVAKQAKVILESTPVDRTENRSRRTSRRA